MPPRPKPLTPEQYLDTGVIPIVPASLADPCNICHQPYTTPLVLACGHIFCRECIAPWVKGGANTCPTCRAELFHFASSSDGGDEEDMSELFGSFALSSRPEYADAVVRAGRPVEEVRVNERAVARDGMLIPFGCRLLIHDLWYHTFHHLCSLQTFGGRSIGREEARDWDVELLRGTIRRAVPDGIRLGEGSWAVLYDAARLMLDWHAMGRSGEARWMVEGGEEWPPGEAFEDMVDALMEAGAAEGGR
ncbi:uncharacterized protein M421DRAFT_6880 [Didymella exigua CBS 183.55]|uniref:RING-type domain-containing protein n=1 Tax=Didymella exigua CBS 183.55 TaxID=1150837 RepID=A0A6A5RHK2_9PLEO|nr:uncharacterized protein M421DRAFT_6880 [Didymella exigua CBS 183.55]KAF1926608.1 hypothetical protein M421DRAFT_6880 [Didymella exigua CBS 183.55]